MTVRRDVNPENEKKLDEMLTKKFGKQSKTIVTGDAVRGTQSLLKRVIKARKQFEDTVFNKPKDQKVDKHGSHDQSAHGKTGRGSLRDLESGARQEVASEAKRRGVKPATMQRQLSQARREADNPNYPPKSRSKRPQGPYSRKVTKRRVGKHGQHDQSAHSPTGRSASVSSKHTIGTISVELGNRARSGNKPVNSKLRRYSTEQLVGRRKQIHREIDSQKVTKRGVSKHGDHDQRTHTPKGRAAISAERGAKSPAPSKVRVRAAAQRVKERVQGAATDVKERVQRTREAVARNKENFQQMGRDIDSVLDGLDAGSRLYQELNTAKDTLMERLKERKQKVTKAKMSPAQIAEAKELAEDLKGKKDVDNPHALARWQVQNKVNKSIEKGIGHSLQILTNAIKLIGTQEADKQISEADEKKLQDLIDEVLGVAGYLDTVKERGYFEKGEPVVPDSTATDRPSFTTPAVAREQKRQNIKPNAKGRGEDTGRVPGY